MMYHSRALILKQEPWNEADWLVTALSADHGKIRLLAQGARKHGAKLQGHLEPGSVSDVSFVIGRGGYRLTTARAHTVPAACRGSLSKLSALTVILAMLDQNLLQERDRARELLATAESALAALEAAPADAAAVRRTTVWFSGRLLAFLGLLPSPYAPEARAMPLVLALVKSPPSVLKTSSASPEELERELAWFTRKLGSAFLPAGPVSAIA